MKKHSKLIVNADDLGLSHSANAGIIKGHQEGVISSASLVATARGYSDALNCIRQCPKLGIGLHFTLTEGHSCAPPSRVPDLISKHLILNNSFSSLYFLLRQKNKDSMLNQIELELNAQLDKVAADGIQIDHINSERHIHILPPIFKLVCRIASERNIPFVRTIHDIGWSYLGITQFPSAFMKGNLFKSKFLSYLQIQNDRSMPQTVKSVPYYASLIFTGRMDKIISKIIQKPPDLVTEVAVHPGLSDLYGDEEIFNPILARYLQSSDRKMELEACLKTEVPPYVKIIRFQDVI